MSRVQRDSVAGRAYLDVQNLARRTRRPTAELLHAYVLEGFLDRLAGSPEAGGLVLKGEVLLAAFAARRPTRDIDLAARDLPGEVDDVLALVRRIATVEVDDGLVFDPAGGGTSPTSTCCPAPTTRTAANWPPRSDDPCHPGGVQSVDEPWDRAQRCEMSLPGQQAWRLFQGPGQFLLVGRLGRTRTDGSGNGLSVGAGVQLKDQLVDHADRVPAVGVRAPGAAWPSRSVPGADLSVLSAGGAGFGVFLAGRAVPVLPAPLQGPQRIAASGAARR